MNENEMEIVKKNDDETKNKSFKNIDSYIDALRVETSYTFKLK